MNLKNLKCIMFDFDETLYTGSDGTNYYEFCVQPLLQLGCFQTESEAMEYLTKNYSDIDSYDLRVVHYMADNNISTKIFEDYSNENIFNIIGKNEIEVVDNDLLEKLSKKYRLVIVSNSVKNYIKHYLKLFGININVFENIYSNKFDPNRLDKLPIMKEAADSFGVPYNQILMVGDSEIYDIKIANELGINSFLAKSIAQTQELIKQLLK